MGFEPDQCPSRVESINEFTERMKNTLEEAKAALAKSKDDMARYYNQKRSMAPKYTPGGKVYLVFQGLVSKTGKKPETGLD